MYLPGFLCLYESFWKGFESDQRRFGVVNIVGIKCLFVWRVGPTVSPIKLRYRKDIIYRIVIRFL